MKKILLLVCLPLSIFSQNTIGLPDVINYSKQVYAGGLQNWDIKQDKNGIIYIANNEGLLTFDGKNWNLFPLPNKTIARSLEIGADNKIYIGGQDELGYFSPTVNDRLQYHSLTKSIPAKDKSFGDVWDIVFYNHSIFFRSTNKIFKFTNEEVAVYNAPSEWAYMGLCNGHLYAHDYQKGLMHFENGAWSPVFLKNDLPLNDPITAILPANQDSALITTLKNGLFMLSGTAISKISSINNRLFESERIYGATTVTADWVALATNNNGLYITDHKGNIIQSYSRTEGLQNNNVLSVFLDNQSNLWLGLDNGIDMISYNSAVKEINPLMQDGSGYAAIVYNNHFFAGTTNGLYSVALQPMKDLSFSRGIFKQVNNTKGQIWSLAEINSQLLLGKHEGAFVIKDNNANLISSDPGFWNFLPLSSTFPSSQIIAGNYNSITFFDFANQQFKQDHKISGFSESSRFVVLDKENNIWVSHPYHGVFKLNKNEDGSYTTFSYSDKKGLPSVLNNHIFKIKNQIVVATEKGIFIYNQQTDSFEPSAYYAKLLGNQSIRYLKEDLSGNIWFIHEKALGVIDYSGKEPVVVNLPELNNKMLSGFEFIYPVDDNNIFVGGVKGFFHINYEKYKKNRPAMQVYIRLVKITGAKDSLLFGGYFKDVNEIQKQSADNIPQLSHQWKTIRLEFSASLFGYGDNLEYCYRLKGFDDKWSDWAKRTEKEYTNLPAGNYSFEIKARNNLGNESPVSNYSFTILPPWYQTIIAKIFYLLFLIVFIYLLYKWQQKKFSVQQTKYEEEQKRLLYIHDLERSKTESELVRVTNEKLQAEINFKNSELASSAMHLVKKGELISKIKSELLQVMKVSDSSNAVTDLKKMIKALSEDDNMDKEWQNFTKHFDKVHEDFLAALKEVHPDITPNELKISAYLRMNLSTKEIAQLMNISVRGVEVSRYRLRKKLKISSETGLFDYLISVNRQQKPG